MTTIQLPKGFTEVNGLLWPTFDVHCRRVVFKMAHDLTDVLQYLRPGAEGSVAVQAGGNCGVWPRALSAMFKTVYTFEPDHENFTALTFNTAELHNVVRLQAALGNKHGMSSLALPDHEANNGGAFYLVEGGSTPILRIDDLALPACDLIYLDIEGYEQNALMGARETISKFRPLIVVEDKGLSEKFGTRQGDVDRYLSEHHEYVMLKRVHRDSVFGHAADHMDIG